MTGRTKIGRYLTSLTRERVLGLTLWSGIAGDICLLRNQVRLGNVDGSGMCRVGQVCSDILQAERIVREEWWGTDGGIDAERAQRAMLFVQIGVATVWLYCAACDWSLTYGQEYTTHTRRGLMRLPSGNSFLAE